MFVLSHEGFFRHFDYVVQTLLHAGHKVTILHGQQKKNVTTTNLSLLEHQKRFPTFQVNHFLTNSWWRSIILQVTRDIIDYATYFRPAHPSPQLAKRLEQERKRFVLKALRWRFLRRLAFSRAFQAFLRRVEKLIRPSPRILNCLKAIDPDVVLACPFIYSDTTPIDYIKAAQQLGIPATVAVASWDNLTTKGTFHVVPDATFVWNQPLVTECVTIHELPASTIQITGAPTFDYWFDLKPSMSYQVFCEQVGLDSHRPYFVYLGSSPTIANDENEFPVEFSRFLLQQDATHDLKILLRPHPLNVKIWQDFSAENVVVWPRQGDLPEAPQTRQNYFNTLYYGIAVAGLNTSAIFEAAIVDKPIISIMPEKHTQTPSGMAHFHHLLKADFMETVNNFIEASNVIKDILGGNDSKRAHRRQFVRDFIRPLGMENKASDIMAQALLEWGERKKLPITRKDREHRIT